MDIGVEYVLIKCFGPIVLAGERKLRVEWEVGTGPVKNERGREEHEEGEFVSLAGKPWLWRCQKGARRLTLDDWDLPSLVMS